MPWLSRLDQLARSFDQDLLQIAVVVGALAAPIMAVTHVKGYYIKAGNDASSPLSVALCCLFATNSRRNRACPKTAARVVNMRCGRKR